MKQLFEQAWHMKQQKSENWLTATVPGSVYSDYLNAGLMDDPFWRENEYKALDLSEADFEYKTTFSLSPEMSSQDKIILVFEGLDTVSSISLNGANLGSTDNMHRTYTFDVKALLKPDQNELHIAFTSPIEYITQMNASDPLWGVDQAVEGYPHLRKAHYMFGWDWGPQLPDMGIWKDVYLEGFSFGKIEDLAITQSHNQGQVDLTIQVASTIWRGENLSLSASLLCPNGQTLRKVVPILEDSTILELCVVAPELWWPNNYGLQPLYALEIELLYKNQTIDALHKRIGLRTLTVRQEPDQWGESFEFVINGISLFSMGGNYIPEDNLLGRTSKEKTRVLIDSCIKANMNTIRVWGGGYYPQDYFFDLCDEYGLIVWQDLPFACSVYRMTEEFTNNVILETKENLTRIRHHASLGLICGNNEIETAFVDWGSFKNLPASLKTDYIKQFEILLPALVKEIAPQIFFWKSSPSSGGHFDRPNDENRGDVHEWRVWHANEPFTFFQDHYYRFLSEFGIQSYPNIKTISSFTLPEDRNIFSPIMENHQKNSGGNAKIFHYIAETFKNPKDFEALLYASQLIQGEGIKYAVEHLRRHRGRCMGAIYWQLNDCWPVASWASLDYFGRWKALHYMARRFFNPILISAQEIKRDHKNTACVTSEKNYSLSPYVGARISVTNDTFIELNGTIHVELKDHAGQVLFSESVGAQVQAFSVYALDAFDFSSYLNTREKARKTYLEYTFEVDDQIKAYGTTLFVKPKHFVFLEPEILVDVLEDEVNFVLSMNAKAFAKYIELDLIETDIIFSDNYFDLSPGNAYQVTCPKDKLTLSEFKEQLKIRSVIDL